MHSSLTRSGLLFILDLMGLFGSYNLAHKLRIGEWIPLTSVNLWLLILVAVIALYVMDVYRIGDSLATGQLPLNTFVAILVVAMVSVLTTYVVGVSEFTSLFGRGVLPVAMVMFAIWAPFTRWVLSKWYESTFQVENWLLICGQATFEDFVEDNIQKFPSQNNSRINIDSAKDEINQWLTAHPRKSGIILENNARFGEGVFSGLSAVSPGSMPILTVAEYYERYWMKMPVLNLEYGWYIRNRGYNLLHDRVGLRLKRLADFLFAIIGMAIAFPLIIVIAVLVYFDSPGSVIFRQRRVGINGSIFTLYKFRSMVKDAEKVGAQWSEVGDPRVTRLGKFLRASRLDELPQLWNLIVGNMSLIGPRPERPEFVEQLKQEIPFYELRHQVPPGLTGWAQVMYAYGSSVKDARIKLEYDLYYIKNHSIRLDLAIILRTFVVILKGLGR